MQTVNNELDEHKGDFVGLLRSLGFDTLARLELDQRKLCAEPVFSQCSHQVQHWLSWQLRAIQDEVAVRFAGGKPGLVGLDGVRLGN